MSLMSRSRTPLSTIRCSRTASCFLPAGLRQFDDDAVVENQVPAPLADALHDAHARSDGAMVGNRPRPAHRRPWADRRQTPADAGIASRVAPVMTRARTLDHEQAVRRLPQREGTLLDDAGPKWNPDSGASPRRRPPRADASAGPAPARSAPKIDWPGLKLSTARMVSGGVRFSPDRCSLEIPKPA